MAWKKQAPKSWEWFQTICDAEDAAETCAHIAASKQLIKFVVAMPVGGRIGQGQILVISCQGTPIQKTPKAKEEAEE